MLPEILNFQPAHEVNNFSCKCYQALFYPLGLRLQPHPLQPAPPRCRVHLHTEGWSVLPLQTETLKSCAQHPNNNKNIPPTCNKEIWEVSERNQAWTVWVYSYLSKPDYNTYHQWALNFWLIKCVQFGSEFVFFRWRMHLATTFPHISIWQKCQPY